MKVNRWFGIIVSMLLLLSVINPMGVVAEEKRTLQDESIYDLLVDRFNNGNWDNDEGVDTKNLHAFGGGDFLGIISRIDYITEMGFTMVSLGSIFSTEKYDGSEVLDYAKLEPHFGTDKELKKMIKAAHEAKVGVIADFQFNGVSENHVWAKDGTLPSKPAGEGIVDWDSSDENVKKMLKEALISFINTYDLDGIRLTKLGDFDTDYLNEVIALVKEEKPDIYVFTNESSLANFDAMPNYEKSEALQQAFEKFDTDSSLLDRFNDQVETDFIQFDELTGPRFTYKMIEHRMFPPARWKLAAVALFTLPGVPVMPYGTEIAMSAEEAPETHQMTNFKTDMELYDLISDMNFLRNESEALRNGDFEMLHNENGFTVFKRSSDEETWIVALNNTTETTNFVIPKDLIGDDKKLRGVLDGNSALQSKDGNYNVVLEREIAEVYIVDEDKGFNIPYLIASLTVYVVFLGFLFVVIRRGKKNAKNREAK